MSFRILYSVALIGLLISFFTDKRRSERALLKAWKTISNIFPQLITIIIFMSIVLALVRPEIISELLGKESGVYGVLIGVLIGSVTLIPGFIAFPVAALFLKNGAGYAQIGAFVSALMMVGVVTLPLEIMYFGKKAAFMRNGLSFVFSIMIAFIIGRLV